MSTPFDPNNSDQSQWPGHEPQGYQSQPGYHPQQGYPQQGQWAGNQHTQQPPLHPAALKALRPWYQKKRYVLALILLAFIMLGQVGGGDDPAGTAAVPAASSDPAQDAGTTASKAPATKAPVKAGNAPESEPEPDTAEYGSQPKDQRAFVNAVAAAQTKADEADNDLKRGSALSQRNKALCKIVGAGKVKNWSGKISSLDANGEGKGVVSVEVGDKVHLSTWNNAFSDISDNTLIEPGALFDKFLEHSEGDVVTFSGTLLNDSDTCVNDSRITLHGKLADPDFVFRFKSVK